jgi:riboflavin kinase/FMN adenylyltransferase
VLAAGSQLPWLDDIDNRINQIKKLGIDIVIVLSFTPGLRQLSAPEFMQLLKDYLKLSGLIIGPDFALGKDRQGHAEQLSLLGQKMGFTVEAIPPLILDGEVVSSSLIRQVLAQGNLQKVSKLLGRPFSISGVVVPGDQRGRTLGFPTANINIIPEQASPPDGVYATIAYINDKPFPSVTNIGMRPTFGSKQRLIETHIMDRVVLLLGQMLKIDFVDKLRNEERFDNAEQLKAQISEDIERAKKVLKQISPANGF